MIARSLLQSVLTAPARLSAVPPRVAQPRAAQWLAPASQQQARGCRPAARGGTTAVRAFSSAQPYWDDDSKPRVNVYSDYTIYKGKAAMALKVIKPTWEHTGGGLKITREGTVLLEFANALERQKYDWEKKETIALSAIECAQVLDVADRKSEAQFYHDPNKGGTNEGQVSKSLRIAPGPSGGWFFSLSVSQAGGKSSISCPVSDAEMRLIKTVMQFLMPRLLGFDEHFAGAPVMAAPNGAAQPAVEGAPF